jgi:acyl carrier protein
MIGRTEILELIGGCLARLNSERPSDKQIAFSAETPLLSKDSQMDSLDFVAFSVDLEEQLQRLAHRHIELAPAAMNPDEHPLRSVSTLTDYILRKLEAA